MKKSCYFKNKNMFYTDISPNKNTQQKRYISSYKKLHQKEVNLYKNTQVDKQ